MSKSLKISAGDLALSNRSLAVVEAQDKLLQDLTLTLLEPIGTDPATPSYGSSLDGGIINGQEIAPFIGQTINPQIVNAVGAEVARVLQQYQQGQLEKMKREALQFQGRTTLADSEVIYSIDSISVTNIKDLVLVKVLFTTLAGTTSQLTFPIGI